MQEKKMSFDIYKIKQLFGRGWCAVQIKISKWKYNSKEIHKKR